jgi:1-acyl-sn-glycerol-3-phosphate acyltransferase
LRPIRKEAARTEVARRGRKDRLKFPVKFMPPIVWLVRTLVGAYPRWIGSAPSANQRIYFANHTSHMDTVVLWAALPGSLRANTRPVAAKDYWGGGGLRMQIARDELNVVMIDRAREDPDADPLDPLRDALGHGFSLIIFPEGTRAAQPLPGPFKSGLYRLATEFPQVELIPVYLENLHRSMPKGALLPVPIICTVRFGAPIALREGESKERFLERVAKVQWGLMISVFCVSHAPAIAELEIPGYEGRSALLLLYFLLVLQLSELLAVIASAAVGRTPLRSNPNKSREGVLIGGLGATLLGTALWWMTPFAWWQAALMPAAIVMAGFMGGLVLASVKRSLGAREWYEGVQLSRGVLDRLDALSFAAPVFFHLTWYLFAA